MHSLPMPRQPSDGLWRSDAQTCRFILSCNYSSKIIDPIQSRCAIYRFKPLGPEAIMEEARRIACREGLTITNDAMNAIVYIAQGDMRKAINALQGAAILNSTIDEKMVYAITSTARPDEIGDLLKSSLNGDFEGAESLLANLLHQRGIAPNELINQCYRAIIRMEMNRELKVRGSSINLVKLTSGSLKGRTVISRWRR